MKYFKIVYSYGNDESYIPIVGDELHRSYALFFDKQGRALFSGGAVSSIDIKRVIPDWNRHFGWNQTYELLPEDWNYVNKEKPYYDAVMEKAQILARYIIKNDRRDLLELPATEAMKEMPTVEKEKVNELTKEVNKLLPEPGQD